jgi:hypothetical protein
VNGFTEGFEEGSRESMVFYPTFGFRTASHDFRYRPWPIHCSLNIIPRCPHCGYVGRRGDPGSGELFVIATFTILEIIEHSCSACYF